MKPGEWTQEQIDAHQARYTDEINYQTRLRIQLAIAAYCYEILHYTWMSDNEYDHLSRKVDLNVDTRRPELDYFFRMEFDPSSGVWVRHHPDIQRIAAIAQCRVQTKATYKVPA